MHTVGAQDDVCQGLQAEGLAGDSGLCEGGHGLCEPGELGLQDYCSATGRGALAAGLLTSEDALAVWALPCNGVPEVPGDPEVLLHGQAHVAFLAHVLVVHGSPGHSHVELGGSASVHGGLQDLR